MIPFLSLEILFQHNLVSASQTRATELGSKIYKLPRVEAHIHFLVPKGNIRMEKVHTINPYELSN